MLRLQYHFIPCPGRSRQHNRTVNGMFQLADVARPAIVEQMAARAGTQHHAGQPQPQSALLAKIARQQHHIIAALAQRRHKERENAQAMEQIGAKTPRQHLFTQVTVGRRQHPHIHAQATIVADALNIAILQHAK